MNARELRDAASPNGQLAYQLERAGIGFVREHCFHSGRKWRLDFVVIGQDLKMLGVEINGGIWTNGRHTRGAALQDEYRKLSEAAIAGYRVLIVTPQDVMDGSAMDLIRRALA